jgi:sulfide:quinone oxidoreductase
MPSGIMGRTVARTIADRISKGESAPAHTASMAAMGAACVASTGAGLRKGTAAAMTMFPVRTRQEISNGFGGLKDIVVVWR